MVKIRDPMTAALEDASQGDSVDRLDPLRAAREDAESAETALRYPDAPPDPLRLAQQAYQSSSRFMESSLRKQWERNQRSFRGRHPTGSKYYSDNYKARSKNFRPKTRHMIRQGEAHIASSYFSNEDVISIRPMDANSKEQAASAEIQKEILTYRLTTANPRIAIPWYVTVIGAYQDAALNGTVASKQWWEYVERRDLMPAIDATTGLQAINPDGTLAFTENVEVIYDRPRVDLFPPENVRIDPAADWRDPINSSPYVILLHPLYIMEVERRMKQADPRTGRPAWYFLDRSQLKSATKEQAWDSTRGVREGEREDSKEAQIAIDEFSIVWCHENFMRWGDRDWVYWTAGSQHLLTDPEPVEEVYWHARNGERPIVMGSMLVEAHKVYPAGKAEIVQGLQELANEIMNLRVDNVKLAMNKRFLVKRGSQTDLRSLLRSSPGSVTLVNDTTTDVKEIDVKDVTASSYAEQDRINADADDLAGIVSPGTVQTNRRLNETVGGMQLLAGAANTIGELDIRTFTETWAEPVLRQLVTMERYYESDVTLIAIAAEKARLFQRFGMSRFTDQLLKQDLAVKINVGIGATDPMQRINKISTAATIIEKVLGEKALMFLDVREFLKEVFGPLGWRDGARFFRFDDQDPLVSILRKELQKAQELIDKRMIDAEAKKEVARLGAIGRILSQQIENQGDAKVAATRALAELWSEQQEMAHDRDMVARENRLTLVNEIIKARVDSEARDQRGNGGTED